MRSMPLLGLALVLASTAALAASSSHPSLSRATPAARSGAVPMQGPGRHERGDTHAPAPRFGRLSRGRRAGAPTASTVPPALANQVIDVYDPSTRVLTIPLVQFRERYYRDLQVRLASFNPVPHGTSVSTAGVFDRFDASGSQLTVPVLRSGTTFYYNNTFEVERVINTPVRVDSFSVPVDLATVTYPASYQTPTTNAADVNLDPCNLALARVTYPATWRGQYPLPPVTNAPLPATFGRGIILKDVGLAPATNPAFIGPNAPGAPAGCSGSLQAELTKTMQRLHTLNSDYLEVVQWHWASAHPDGSWYFTPAEATFGSITDADLALLVQKAHAQGVKVIMFNQIQGFLDNPNGGQAYIPPATQANYQKWFAAFNAYITERASVFQQMGVDVWEVGCNACMYGDDGDGSPATVAYFISQYQTVLDNMKALYSGKTEMTTNRWLYQTPAFASRLDMIGFGFMGAPPPDPTAPLTVASYKAAMTQRLQQIGFSLFDPLGKTYLVHIGLQSRSNAFTLPGYMEETVCTAAFGDLNPGADACVEREAVTDFSMQAIAVEGTLEAIKDFSWQTPPIVVAGDYWETDSLMPFTAFPQIAYSVRNKPAEGILKAWFAR